MQRAVFTREIFYSEQSKMHDKINRLKGKELASLEKVLREVNQASSDPNFIQNLEFVYNLKNTDSVLSKRTAFTALLKYCSKTFHTPSCRAAQKHKEAELLSLAVHFNSIVPFLKSSRYEKNNGIKVILDLKKGTEYLTERNEIKTIDKDIIIEIPAANHKEALEISPPQLEQQTLFQSYEDNEEYPFDQFNENPFDQYQFIETPFD